jgi:anaerobic sulfite reductase subunit C
LSVDTKKIKKNAYRVTKTRGKTCLRVRVPGGHLPSQYLEIIKEIADKFGNGTVHLTTRQGFEIPGIDFSSIEMINQLISPMIVGLEKEIGVPLANGFDKGYPAAGTRNVSACIGNRVCTMANCDTTALAQKIERTIFPNDFHVKIAVTGCPNDCIKAHMQDIGVIAQVEPLYDETRCISCKACVKNCQKVATGALTMGNYKVERDPHRCLGCGECILKCPNAAWTRGNKFYRLVIMGRTGKRNPRLAQTFVQWASEDVVLGVIKNMYKYIDKHIDRTLEKEHVGYIFDRTGYNEFKNVVLEGIQLNPEIRIATFINFHGSIYDSQIIFENVTKA